MQLAGAFFSPHDRLLIAIFGLLLHVLILRRGFAIALLPFTPYGWGASVMAWFERRLNRVNRGQSALRVRGLLSASALFVWCVAAGFILSVLAQHVPHGEVIEVVLVCLALNARAPAQIAWQLLMHLKRKQQIPVALLVSIQHPAVDVRDGYSVTRAAIEVLFTRFCAEVVAPVMWYVLAGLPGLVLCGVITLSERQLRERGLHGALFGVTLRVISQLIHFIPSRVAGVLTVIASVFIPSCHPVHALMAMFGEAEKLRTTSFGWILGALSGALGLALGGPRSQYLLLKPTPWIGGGSARPGLRDLARAMFLYGLALQLVLLVLALALYAYKHL